MNAARPRAPRPLIRPRLPLLTILLLCLPAFAAFQDNSGKAGRLTELTLEQLGKIEVTSASKDPEQVWHTPAAIYVITQEDIRRSGARNLPDILRLAPGVEVAQIDSDKWSVGIRGFSSRLSRSVLVLIDGRSVYTPLFAGVYWEMQDTLIQDIDRIEVIRGPGGTIWGANAVNGVINIITKNARDTHGPLVTVGGGSVDQGFISTRYGAGSKDFSYRLYGKFFTRGPQFHSDDRNFDDWKMGQVGFRTDWNVNSRDSLTIQGDSYRNVSGQSLNVSTYSPPALIAIERNINLLGTNFVGRWKRQLSESSDLQLQAYFDRTQRDDINFEEVRDTIDFDLVAHTRMGRHQLIGGAGGRVSPSHFSQVVETVDFEPHDQTYNIFSGFVQDEIALLPHRLSFTVGTKLEHNTFSGFEIQPSARILWTPTSHQSLWASVTRAVRTPSRIEDNFQFTAVLVPSIPLYVRLIGDGDFSAEQLTGYELGYRTFFKPNVYVDVASFYNQYDDLLSVENIPPIVEASPAPPHLLIPLFLRNGVQADTAGIEISPVWDPTTWWRLKGSYSYLHLNAHDKATSDDVSTVGQLEGDSPQHRVVVQSSWNLSKDFELDLIYRYVSALPDQNVPAYSTGDARFGWRLSKQFELSLVGQNLLQPHHPEFGGDPGPLVEIRRSAYARLTWTR